MEISELKMAKVLDLATGVGQFIPYLLAENESIESVIGVDVCERSLEQASKNFTDPRVSFQKSNAKDLPFASNLFEGITINNSLHHFENIPSVLAEASRVLADCGYLIINEMCSDEGQSPAQQSHIMIHHWFADLDKMMNRFHDYTYTSEKLRNLVTENGLKIIHQYIYDHAIPNPKDENLVRNYRQTITNTKMRAEQNQAPSSFLEKADTILVHLDQHGYSPARSILIIAQKCIRE